MLRRSLTVVLRNAGYELTAVGSAEEADEEIKNLQPDLVMLDWMLPAQSGGSLRKTWRSLGLKCPVILLTARDAVADRVKGLEAGANDYLTQAFYFAESYHPTDPTPAFILDGLKQFLSPVTIDDGQHTWGRA